MSMSPTRKSLPCPGNTVGGAKHHLMTWPGHGSAFQKLPRQRNGQGGLLGVVVAVSLAVWWYRGPVVCRRCGYCCQSSGAKKNPINRRLQGIEGGGDVVLVWRSCLFGRLGVLWTWSVVRCFVARVHKNQKKPCNHWFTGLFVVAKTDYVSIRCFQMAYSSSRGTREGGGASPSEIE